MTLVRRKALEISSWVTWLASSGCKEWAEGLEREVAFIESDWRALGWALGSVRVVLDRRETPIGTLEEAFEAAQKFFDKLSSHKYGVGLLMVFFSFAAVSFIISAPSFGLGSFRTRALQIGLFLLLAGFLYAGYRYYARLPRELNGPLCRYETVAKYRDELQRDHNALHGWRRWLGALTSYSVLVVICAFMGRREFEEFFLHFPGMLLLLQIPLGEVQFRLRDRKNRRRIAELDTLLARGAEGAGV